MSSNAVLHGLKAFYAEMDKLELTLLDSVYSANIMFTDPVQTVQGLDALKSYLQNSVANVSYCHFVFEDEAFTETQGFLRWQMQFAHSRINSGNEIQLPGVSHLTFDPDSGLIIRHVDFYDMGALVYEHIPVMGWLTRQVKQRIKNA